MGTTLRTRYDFLGGMVENNPLSSAGTSLTSAALAVLPAISGSGLHYVPITLDPDGLEGPPEIAWITDHNAFVTTATLLRGQEGTTARAHYQDTPWVHGPTSLDIGANDTDMAILRAQAMITGGGIKTVTASNISWTQRFIAIGMGQGVHFSTDGHFSINMPTVGTVISGLNGSGSRTVTASGITLGDWESLWWAPTIGGSNASGGTFYCSPYGNSGVIPRHWIMVAYRNGDSFLQNMVKWCDGTFQDYWRGLSLVNGWVDYALGYPTPGYMKDGMGYVHFRGLIRSGTLPSNAFQLPVGYRPGNDRGGNPTYVMRHLVGQANSQPAAAGVTAEGWVNLANQNAWWDLGGLTPFLAEA